MLAFDSNGIDFTQVSEETKLTMRTYGVALQAGFRVSEIAVEDEVSRHVVRRRLERAKRELERNAGGDRACMVCGERIAWNARADRETCSPRCRVTRHRQAKANASRSRS